MRGRKIKGRVPYRNKQLKNVLQGRSYFRKGLEAHFTVLIEFIWGKERIGSGIVLKWVTWRRRQQNIGEKMPKI
jgi:hypothetical protein